MKVIEELEGLVSSKLGVIKTLFTMIKLEARLARLSIFPLILNGLFLFVILLTTWLTVLLAIGYSLMQAYHSAIIAFGSVLLINVVLLGLLFSYLLFNLKKMSFEKTRQYLFKNKDQGDNELKKTSH